jgi:hypothetical protein
MSWYSRNPPDLATFGDLDAVLNKIGDITVREPVRQYYRILYYVQQIRSAKWCLFALFVTMFFEVEIKALFPGSFQAQALVALVISFLVLSVLWTCEYATLTYGGDPADLFETRDEELAIAHELGSIALNALPQPRAVISPPPAHSNMGALFEMPSATKTTTSAKSGEQAAPLAKINGSNPRTPVNLSTLPSYRSSGSGQVRAGLLNFNSRPSPYTHKKQ